MKLGTIDHHSKVSVTGGLMTSRLQIFLKKGVFVPTQLCNVLVVGAPTSQSVDLGFNPLVESYQKTLKNGIYSFSAWCSAFIGGCGEQASKFACGDLGQGT